MSIYTGINGVNKNWSSLKIGVNGVVKTANNGFIGINGVSKSFYTHKAEDIVRFEIIPTEITTSFDATSIMVTRGTYTTFAAMSNCLNKYTVGSMVIVYGSSRKYMKNFTSPFGSNPDGKHIEITLGGTEICTIDFYLKCKLYAIFPDGSKKSVTDMVNDKIITSINDFALVDFTKYDNVYYDTSAYSFSGWASAYGLRNFLSVGDKKYLSTRIPGSVDFSISIYQTNCKRHTLLVTIDNIIVNNNIIRPVIITNGN